MPRSFKGVVKARVIEAKFALSGKVAGVSKHTGDAVKKWDLIASLDRKMLQMELDKELADFEKVRADFEGFAKKFPDPQDDNKFTKAEKQASLNASVKSVELAKARLDMVNLFSPVEGVIIDDSGIVPGLYVTPAGSSVKIVDSSSYRFEIEIEQKDIKDFEKPREVKITIEGAGRELKTSMGGVQADGKVFRVAAPISEGEGIFLGLHGKAEF